MELLIRPARPPEFEEAGRVTALAYREFARPGERAWTEYLEHIADVAGRSQRALVLVGSTATTESSQHHARARGPDRRA